MQRLRPRSAGRLLDGGFDVVQFRPIHIIVLLVATWAPVYLVTRLIGGYPELVDWATASLRAASRHETSQPFPRSALIGILALAFGEMLTGVGIGFLLGAWLRGADPRPVTVLAHVARRLPATVGAWLLALVIKVASASVLAPALGVTAPVLGGEGVGPLRAVQRSLALTRRIRGLALGLFLLSPLLSGLIAVAIDESRSHGVLPIGLLGPVLAAAATATLTAWRASVWGLVHVNSRVVDEGLDLRLELARVTT